MLVLDTSALLYWTLAPSSLSKPADRAIGRADEIVISSITIWEIALKASRGRLVLPMSIADYVSKLKQVEPVKILPVDEVLWMRNVALPWEHRDPADRTIVATALERDCPLVSSDRVIAEFYPKTVW